MAVERIPLEVLTSDPQRSNVQISPDGRRLAYAAPHAGAMNIWVDDRPVTAVPGHGVSSAAWAWDARHLLYARDQDGDENYHLFAVDPDTGETRDLTPLPGVRAQLVGLSPSRPDEVVAQLNVESPGRYDAYRIRISDGSLDKLAEGESVSRWLVDTELRLRGFTRLRGDGGVEIVVRDDEAAPWRVAWSAGMREDDALMLALGSSISFDADGRHLYLTAGKGANTLRLLRLDLSTGEEAVLLEDPQNDVVAVRFNRETGRPELAFIGRARQDLVVLEPSLQPDVDAIRPAQDDAEVDVVSRTRADDLWIVTHSSPHRLTRYFKYHRAERRLELLFESHPQLAPYRLAEVEPFSFTSSDGLTVHGYLTFPPDAERRGLAAVALVHGGPHGRDPWAFNVFGQMLANRGYLAVQVNYRGSSGYGRSFLEAGRREWAGRMHQDVLEAMDWVVAQGFADRTRLGIMGGSYGGYETLVGLTFTPEYFRCGVSLLGPVNLITLLETIPPYWIAERAYFHDHIGTLEHDRDLLWERSPLRLADKIKAPVLLIYGENDPRVKISEGEQMVEALRRNGIPHQYVTFPDEGHGLVRAENRLKAMELVETFLAEHLPSEVAAHPA